MAEDYDSDENVQKGHIRLKQGINLNVLQSEGEVFEINFENLEVDETKYSPKDNNVSELTAACLGMDSGDESDDDVNVAPFEKMSRKMVSVTDDGKIKKKIKREGAGETPPSNSMVFINYISYLEYNDEPIDYTYAKKPYQFRLGNAILFGLNIAVQSMRVNEKSVFLIDPIYAYGPMGHPPRIPPNATFLFQIELLRFIDSGPAVELNDLTKEERKMFPVARKTALALIENAKEYFKHNLKLAIREYNKAASIIESCQLSDMSEQEQQQRLLYRIYTNLAVCYNQDSNPRRACTMCNNIFAISQRMHLNISAKVYFHNGRAYLQLGDYQRAREKLLKARQLEPENPEISSELAKVSAKMRQDVQREQEFARAFMRNLRPQIDSHPTNSESQQAQNNSNSQPSMSRPQVSAAKQQSEPKDVDPIFKEEIKKLCIQLMENVEQNQFKLPSGLTKQEREVAKIEAESHGLTFCESNNLENDGKLICAISKF